MLETHDALVTLANDELSLDVLATSGARIASLFDRRSAREWLSAPRGDSLVTKGAYGSTFTDHDHFGWDEMFPSVDPCVYPSGRRQGAAVPDHGELWSSTWELLETTDASLHQRFTSSNFDYVFERTLRIDESTLRADYSCVASGEEPVALLWALHPQFSMPEGSRVVLRGVGDALLDTTDASNPFEVPWSGDLCVERDVLEGHDRMLYVRPGESIDEVSLLDVSGSWLRVTWDHCFAPYLGLWLDHAHHTTRSVVAIEPTNGFFDDLERALAEETLVSIEPDVATTWWVEMRLGRGELA